MEQPTRKDQITLENFALLVQQMRHTQRRAQKFNKPEILQKLSVQESEIDRQLSILFSTQLSLF